jgi:hypothetical protein
MVNQDLHSIPSNIATGINPKVSIRGTWSSPHCRKVGDNDSSVGTGIAFEFDEALLVVTAQPNLPSWTGKPKKRELARNPEAHGLSVRWLPKEIALHTLPCQEAHIDGIPQPWLSYARMDEFLAIDTRQSMKWRIELTAEGLLIKPEHVEPMYYPRYLRFCRTYNVKAAATSKPHIDTYIKVCRAYGKDWIECRNVDFFRPIGRSVDESSYMRWYTYPERPEQGWGWIRPDAPFKLKMQGFVFDSVYAWAVNPTLWIREELDTHNANFILSERLAAGARARLEQDAAWREQVVRWGTPLDFLAHEAPCQQHAYFAEIVKFVKSQLPEKATDVSDEDEP